MLRMLKMSFALLLLAGWGLAGLSLHVVRTPAVLTILPKDSLAISDTYADTRSWKPSDLQEHKALVTRLLATDRLDSIRHVIDQDRDASSLRKQLQSSAQSQRKSEDVAASVTRVIANHGLDLAWGN